VLRSSASNLESGGPEFSIAALPGDCSDITFYLNVAAGEESRHRTTKIPTTRFCGQLQVDHHNPMLALVNLFTIDYEVLDSGSGYRLSDIVERH
jgi:hypothetical protein